MNPQRHVTLNCVCWMALIQVCAIAPAVTADAVEAISGGAITMTIQQGGRAVIRETFKARLDNTNTVVRFPTFPIEADSSSIYLKEPRGDVRMIEWHLAGLAAEEQKMPMVNPAGSGVQLDFVSRSKSAQPFLEATIESQASGSRTFDLIYQVTGLTWQASYDVLLRGDLNDVTNLLSIDVDGWIEIDNRTGRTFSNASVIVIGSDSLGKTETGKEPGLLELDDESPLSDLWRYFPPEPKVANIYPLKSKITLPASQNILFSHASVVRKPVDRLFVIRAEEIPTDSRASYGYPSQIISFKNASDYGGNRAVPPGLALIHLGNQRASLHQKAWIKHTPAQGEIRLDMGRMDGIRARRVVRGRNELVGGGYEQVFELRLENVLDQQTQVVVDEQPPATMAWTIIRATQPYTLLNQRMVFNPVLPPKAELIIQYTVRYTLPGT